MRLLICFLLVVTGWTQTGMMRVQRRAVASAATCGHATQEATAESGNANYQFAGAPCVPVSSVSVVDCKVYIGTAGGDLNCAVYDSDGSDGSPLTLLCQGTSRAATADSWNTFTLSGCGTLTASHPYWVVANNSLNAIQYMRVAGGTSYYGGGFTCCTFANYSSTPSIYANTLSMYLDVL